MKKEEERVFKEELEKLKKTLDAMDGVDKEKMKILVMDFRSSHLVQMFITALTKKLYENGHGGVKDFIAENSEKIEYVYLPVPVAINAMEEFEKEVKEICGICPVQVFCNKFEKNIHVSLMKGLILETVKSLAQKEKVENFAKNLMNLFGGSEP